MRNVLLRCLVSLLFWNPGQGWAQNRAVEGSGPRGELSAFVDVFYAWDFDQPGTSERQSFLYNHNRHHEFNVNLALLRADLTHEKYRGHLALQTGTYARDNYAAEPGVLKNIFEAYLGLALRENLWLDAGIFSSHLGFESAVSLDNWTLTRSLVAESSPYYLSGARLTFTPNDRWEAVLVVCNGWQRISRVPGNSLLSGGTQVSYTPASGLSFNWSTFVGTDDPDSTRRMRYFNNWYIRLALSEKLGLIAGFDLGVQQRHKGSAGYDMWFSPVLIGRYHLAEEWAVALRLEYYDDENEVIVPTGTPRGFQTGGLSLNLDYTPFPDLSCRIEGRWFGSRDRIFTADLPAGHNNVFVVTSLALRFGT